MFVLLGHHVSCVDTDASKIARLQRGESPICEPQLELLLQLAGRRGGIEFATELGAAAAASDVIFIAVGTPPYSPATKANLCHPQRAAARGVGSATGLAFRVSAWW